MMQCDKWTEKSYSLENVSFEDYQKAMAHMAKQNPVTDDYIIIKYNYNTFKSTAEIVDRTRIKQEVKLGEIHLVPYIEPLGESAWIDLEKRTVMYGDLTEGEFVKYKRIIDQEKDNQLQRHLNFALRKEYYELAAYIRNAIAKRKGQ
jgi:hypothetical protein